MAHAKKAPFGNQPCAFVIFGATGNLHRISCCPRCFI